MCVHTYWFDRLLRLKQRQKCNTRTSGAARGNIVYFLIQTESRTTRKIWMVIETWVDKQTLNWRNSVRLLKEILANELITCRVIWGIKEIYQRLG